MSTAKKELDTLADRCQQAYTPTALEAPVAPDLPPVSAPPTSVRRSAAQKWQDTPRWAKLLVYLLGALAPFSGVLSDVVRGLFASSP